MDLVQTVKTFLKKTARGKVKQARTALLVVCATAPAGAHCQRLSPGDP
jgi:hypothetical protein